eukprot:1526662-Prymnesium_polylepis.1
MLIVACVCTVAFAPPSTGAHSLSPRALPLVRHAPPRCVEGSQPFEGLRRLFRRRDDAAAAESTPEVAQPAVVEPPDAPPSAPPMVHEAPPT